MIKTVGENFVQFKKSAFAELITELTKVEGYMIGRCDTLNGCDYWGIVDAEGEENCYVNLDQGLSGEEHGVTWFDLKAEFPRLIELLDEHNLHYYIGKNYVGNWGVHRHIYDESSTMNLCLLVKGNNGGTVNFHEFDNELDFEEMSNDHIFDLHDKEFSEDTIIESLNITKELSAETVVISLGSNDHKKINTLKELFVIREVITARHVYWIIPANNPDIQEMVEIVADKFEDKILRIPEVSKDKVHPTTNGYKSLANSTK